MKAPPSPAYVPEETITRRQWHRAPDARPKMAPTARPGVRYAAAERRAREDPTGDRVVTEILADGGFIIRETVTVREIVFPRRATAAEARARASALGLSENGGKWLATPAVLEALAGRALAEVFPGPRGSWSEDVRLAP